MRCRVRYRTGWTLFLCVCTLIGIFLTYRQIGSHHQKHSDRKFYNPQDDLLNEFHQEEQATFEEFPPPNKNFQEDSLSNDNKNKFVAQEPADIMRNKDIYNRSKSPPMDNMLKLEVRSILHQLYPTDWGKAADAIDMAISVKSFLMDLDMDSKMSCKDIDYLRVSQSIKITRRKYVDRAFVERRGSEVIIKSQAVDQDVKIKCMQSKYDVDKCQVMGNYNLLREIVLLSLLKHPIIIKLRGYCIRGDSINYNLRKKGVVLVTEPGMVVNIANLASYNWKSKILYAIQLSDLLKYLENTPLGSLRLGSVRATDFVLVDQWIKLVDLDELAMEETACQVEADCKIIGAAMYKIVCENGRCVNRNAKQNLRTLGVELLEQLLMNPPPSQKDKVFKLRQRILTLNITASELMEELNKLKTAAEKLDSAQWKPVQAGKAKVMVRPIQDSALANRQHEEIKANRVLPNFGKEELQHDYIRIAESNFPGTNDYTCPASRVAWGCVITIRSLAQAKTTCDADPVCRAFVVFTSNPDIASE